MKVDILVLVYISSLCCGGTSKREEQMVLFIKRFDKKTEGTRKQT